MSLGRGCHGREEERGVCLSYRRRDPCANETGLRAAQKLGRLVGLKDLSAVCKSSGVLGVAVL